MKPWSSTYPPPGTPPEEAIQGTLNSLVKNEYLNFIQLDYLTEHYKNDFTLGQLNKGLALCPDFGPKKDIIRDWFTYSRLTPSAQELKDVLEFTSDRQAIEAARDSLIRKQAQYLFEDIKDIPIFTRSATFMDQCVQDFNFKDIEQLKHVLSSLEGFDRDDFINKFMSQEENAVSFEQLNTLLGFLPVNSVKLGWYASSSSYYGEETVNLWLKNNPATYDTLIKDILPNAQEETRHLFIRQWQSQDNKIDFDHLMTDIVPLLPKDDCFSVIYHWMDKGNTINQQQLVEHVLPAISSDERKECAEKWIEDNNVTIEQLKPILNTLDDEEKATIATDWLKKTDPDHVLLGNIFQTLQQEAGDNNKEKDRVDSLAKSVLKKLGEYDKSVEEVYYDDTGKKIYLATEYLIEIQHKESENAGDVRRALVSEIDGEDKLATLFEEVGGFYKAGSEESADANYPLNLHQERSQEKNKEKYDNFVALAQEHVFISAYDVAAIAEAYCDIKLPISKIPDLTKTLYPSSEDMQVDLFVQFIQEDYITDNPEHIALVKDFCAHLKKDSSVLTMMEALENSLELDAIYFASIAGDRLNTRYESLAAILKGRSLQESLTEEGLEGVKEVFGEAYVGNGELTLAGLLSYYDIRNNLEDFIDLLKPDVLEDIQKNFQPSNQRPFMLGDEYEKIQALTGADLPSTKDLAEYLSKKVTLEPIMGDKQKVVDYQVHFPEALEEDFTIEAKQEAIQEAFKDILQADSDDISKEKVEYFIKSLELGEYEINKENLDKLTEFMAANRNEMANLLQKKGGLDKFVHCVSSLSDGCVANIATLVRSAMYSSLIEDPIDSVLYRVFSEKIAIPLINSGGDNLGVGSAQQEHTNIFTNDMVVESVISPPGLLRQLEAELYDKEQNQCNWKLATDVIVSGTKRQLEQGDWNEMVGKRPDKEERIEVIGEISQQLGKAKTTELQQFVSSAFSEEKSEKFQGMISEVPGMDEALEKGIGEARKQEFLQLIATGFGIEKRDAFLGFVSEVGGMNDEFTKAFTAILAHETPEARKEAFHDYLANEIGLERLGVFRMALAMEEANEEENVANIAVSSILHHTGELLQHASLQAEKQFYEEKTEQTDVQFAEGRDWQAVPAVEPPVEKSKDDMWIDKTSSKKDQRMSQNVDAVIDPIPSSSSHADRVKQGGGGKSFEI